MGIQQQIRFKSVLYSSWKNRKYLGQINNTKSSTNTYNERNKSKIEFTNWRVKYT